MSWKSKTVNTGDLNSGKCFLSLYQFHQFVINTETVQYKSGFYLNFKKPYLYLPGGKNTYANISAFKMPDVPALCLFLLTTKLSLNALQVEVCESEHCWSSSKQKDGSSRTDVEESLSYNTHYSL